VKHLNRLGIRELSTKLGADEFAMTIRQAALEPFRWHNQAFQLTEPAQSGNASGSAADGAASIPDIQGGPTAQQEGLDASVPRNSAIDPSTAPIPASHEHSEGEHFS
jgi:hypothetical protein